MSKWVCSVCGYVHEGDTPPEKCPLCKQPASVFKKVEEAPAKKQGYTRPLSHRGKLLTHRQRYHPLKSPYLQL